MASASSSSDSKSRDDPSWPFSAAYLRREAIMSAENGGKRNPKPPRSRLLVCKRRFECAAAELDQIAFDNSEAPFLSGRFYDRWVDICSHGPTADDILIQTGILALMISYKITLEDSYPFDITDVQREVAEGLMGDTEQNIKLMQRARLNLRGARDELINAGLPTDLEIHCMVDAIDKKLDPGNYISKRPKKYTEEELRSVKFTYDRLLVIYRTCGDREFAILRLLALHMIIRFFVGVGTMELIWDMKPDNVGDFSLMLSASGRWSDWPIVLHPQNYDEVDVLGVESDEEEEGDGEGEGEENEEEGEGGVDPSIVLPVASSQRGDESPEY